MSININISIPIDSAIAIRGIDYALERLDGDVEFTLTTITSAVIEAIKELSDDFLLNEIDADYEQQAAGSAASASASTPRSSSATTSYPSDPSTSASICSTTDSRLKVTFYEDYYITIIDPTGRQHTISTCSEMTIEELQAKVDTQCLLSSSQKRLVWRGYRLNQPDATLGQYGIGPGCTLVLFHHLLPNLPDERHELPPPAALVDTAAAAAAEEESFEFWLATPSGQSISAKANPDTTTAELATAVWRRLGILPSLQRLVFQGMVVYDGSSYAAGEDHLIFTLDEVCMLVNFIHRDEALRADETTTTAQVSIMADSVVSVQIANSAQ